VEDRLYAERVWFYDSRSPVRRMGVSAHPVDSTMIISLWQGDVCTGTFRLPALDAAGLISTLAYGMVKADSGDRPGSDMEPSALRRMWAQLVHRLSVRWRVPADSHLRLLK
jgi:hypothetical protein